MTERVGSTSVLVDTGADQRQWLRLTAFEDGWVEHPTFGRPTSAVGDLVRKVLVRLVLAVAVAATAWGVIALSAAAGSAFVTVVKVAGGVPLMLLLGWWLVRAQRRKRVRRPWTGALEDLTRLRAAGIAPRRVPGVPWWRRARSAAEAAARTTNVVLVRAIEVASVQPGRTADGDSVVQVLLHSGGSRIYRSRVYRGRDAAAFTLLSRFGVPG